MSSGLLYDVDIADELAVLTDRHVERRDLLSEELLQLLDNLAIAHVVVVHLRDKNHSRQVVLLAEFPGLLRSDLYAVLTRDNDDCRIGDADSLFHFTDEIKISRCIEDIDLVLVPLNRDHRCGDRKLPSDLFLVIIAERIAVSDRAHSVCRYAMASASVVLPAPP